MPYVPACAGPPLTPKMEVCANRNNKSTTSAVLLIPTVERPSSAAAKVRRIPTLMDARHFRPMVAAPTCGHARAAACRMPRRARTHAGRPWSLTSLQQRLVKSGGRLIKQARYYWLLLAEKHLTRPLFADMLRRIAALPSPAG